MFSRISSFGLCGLNCCAVNVETDISGGMPSFEIVGLPDMAVKESRDRVRSAIKNCGYNFPLGRITVNLSPADFKKVGPVYDLAILLGILCASGQIPDSFEKTAFAGELSLDGGVRSVNGVLSMTIKAREMGFDSIVVPFDNRFEAGVIDKIAVLPATGVAQVIGHFFGRNKIEPFASDINAAAAACSVPDFCDVRGQDGVKHALEIAASGGHNVLMIGSPGAGKSMLAKRIPSILPEMTFEESLRTTEIYSVAGMLAPGQPLCTQRPFRAPHHTVSPFGLSGGGVYPRPGEISLAHNGVLFLDELPEFSPAALEILRQPLEDGYVTVSRVSGTVTFPCTFMTVAAMNPCKCGYLGHPTRKCVCPPGAPARYLRRISGPLLDRFDMHIGVMPVEFDELTDKSGAETSAQIRARVNRARTRQTERLMSLTGELKEQAKGIYCNARLTEALCKELCPMSDRARTLLRDAFKNHGMTARAYNRILKVSRTVADLCESDIIEEEHVFEAIQYRGLEEKSLMKK